jgi:rRNA maturation RNase YbeY
METEGFIPGEIHYVFCDDTYLLSINEQYLNHHDFTDIITFSLSEVASVIRGEIFISVERVNENATINGVGFGIELARVLVHGVLHLVGYDDHTMEEKSLMRSKENYYINLLPH